MTTSSPSPATSPRRGLKFFDRCIVAGRTGSGKSVLINHIAAGIRCQRFLYDTKDEFTIPGVERVHRVEQIDWNQPVIHYVDDEGNLKDTDRVFRTLWQRKVGRSGHAYGLVVIVHELGDLCADQPGGTPQWVSNYIRKGRAHGLGLIAGSQRPRNIPRVARTEVQHVFSFAGGFDPEDLPIMAALHHMRPAEFERALEQAHQLGEHAYIWWDDRARSNVIRPQLPEALRAHALAHGIDPSKHRTPGELPENEDELPERSGSVPGKLPEHPVS